MQLFQKNTTISEKKMTTEDGVIFKSNFLSSYRPRNEFESEFDCSRVTINDRFILLMCKQFSLG